MAAEQSDMEEIHQSDAETLKKKPTAFWILRARVSAYPDLAELHLDLFGDDVGPVLLSQEVPEYPSQKSIHPGLGLHRLP